MTAPKKHSKKRDAILQAIRDTDCHPSAEWIYEQVKNEYPDISLGTVYRNLSIFEQNGDIITVATVDGQKRYDAIARPHVHFICESCNSVTDIAPCLDVDDMYSSIERQQGFKASRHTLSFYGRCDKCQANK